MRRRTAWLAGMAVAAGGAGLGAALWRARPAGSRAMAPIWAMRFDTPSGGSLSLATLRGRPLLLNFWATWCPPCVRELPLLDRFEQAQRVGGWQVVGLAVDERAPVVDFLRKSPVGFAIGLAGLDGVALSRTLGNATGALPFSVVFDRTGEAVQRKLGAIETDDLTRWVGLIG